MDKIQHLAETKFQRDLLEYKKHLFAKSKKEDEWDNPIDEDDELTTLLMCERAFTPEDEEEDYV